MSSNWQKLQARISPGGDSKKRKRPPASTAAAEKSQQQPAAASTDLAAAAPSLPLAPLHVADAVTPRLALDCEMVGVGDGGQRSALARVVIVGFDERVAYSTFVKPPEPVTDWRTAVSGVRREHMAHALPLRRVQAEVAALLRERTVVGHALHNDLKALMLEHPKRLVRDTASYPAYRKQQGATSRPRRLKWLAQEHLGWQIQGAEHSPAEDAVAALRLYKLRMSEWERACANGGARDGVEAHTQTSSWERALAKGTADRRFGGKKKKQKRREGA